MAYDADNVAVATSGTFYRKGNTALTVTSATSALTGAIDLGLLTEDGAEVSSETERTTINGWQSKGAVRDIITSGVVKYKLVFMENTEAVQALYFGAGAVNGKIEWDPTTVVRDEFVLDVFDSKNGELALVRHHILDGGITAIDPLTYNGTTPITFGIEITAYRKNGRCADIYDGTYNTSGATSQGGTSSEPTATTLTLNDVAEVIPGQSFTVSGTSTGRSAGDAVDIVIDATYYDAQGVEITGYDVTASTTLASNGSFSYGPVSVPSNASSGSVVVTASFPLSGGVSDTYTANIPAM